ncbi:MAG TPA: hypothetical protein VL992_13825 [Tepidisphaeraceae bacterium]|nr:hypothetical protein [Tepidisphaeraceae bacterium]
MQDGRSLLAKSFKELLFRWADTKSQWNDSMSQGFERTRLQTWEQDLKSATAAMDHMAQILNQAKRDCS